jgi:biopolymer transport protein ExbD
MTKARLRPHKNPYALPAVAARPLKLWQDDGVDREPKIELVPLIDVIFCILVFFLLAALQFSRQQAINLQLPQASTGSMVTRDTKIVSIDDQGLLYEEGSSVPVTKDSLRQSLTAYHKANPQGTLVLHASRNITYSEVIQVLDILKSVGGNRVALATLPGESQPTYVDPNLNTLPNTNTQIPNSSVIPDSQSLPNLPTNTGNNGSIDNSQPKQNTVKSTVPPAPTPEKQR